MKLKGYDMEEVNKVMKAKVDKKNRRAKNSRNM